MKVEILNPEQQTLFFGIVFFIACLVSIRKSANRGFFSVELTNELKGMAILAVIFAHIGYLLSSSDKFLFPFSILAGVGVNLFLFLSGFGITLSALRSKLSIPGFYKKRLLRIFIPLWIAITIFYLIDWLYLNRTYSVQSILESYLGIYRNPNNFVSVNPPLWYINVILVNYLLFPLLTFGKLIFISPILIYLLSVEFFKLNLGINLDTLNLMKSHNQAFPIGMAFALFLQQIKKIPIPNPALILKKINKTFFYLLKYLLFLILLGLFAHFAIYSHVGEGADIEQRFSLLTMGILIAAFTLKDFEINLFNLFGKFSYEVYLVHWPLLFRYDFLYKDFPPFLATILYLILFLIVSLLLQKLSDFFVRTLKAV